MEDTRYKKIRYDSLYFISRICSYLLMAYFPGSSFSVLLSCCGILISLMAIGLMFCNFSNNFDESSRKRCSCCGQTCFLFLGAILLLPLVVWTAIVVFISGYPSEENQGHGLQCDLKFWKATFWIVIALIVFSFIIFLTLIVSCCKKCSACCKFQVVLG